MDKKLVIIGAGGHGKVVADIAKKCGYADIVFLDDNASVTECGGYAVAGTSKEAARYRECHFIVAVGNAQVRRRIQEQLAEEGLQLATLIHPNAVIGENVSLQEGTVVMAGTVINPGTVIEKGCIINTCASVDHDCVIGAYAHVSVGAHVAGTVNIGAHTWVGAGAIISNNIEITSDCVIGAGAVVIKSLPEAGVYIGVPARKFVRE